MVSGTRSRCCNAWPTNHEAPTMGDPLCPSLCPLCLCGSDYSESLQGIGLRCAGAGYIPPLSIKARWVAQGRHICRPYSTLASSVVGVGFACPGLAHKAKPDPRPSREAATERHDGRRPSVAPGIGWSNNFEPLEGATETSRWRERIANYCFCFRERGREA